MVVFISLWVFIIAFIEVSNFIILIIEANKQVIKILFFKLTKPINNETREEAIYQLVSISWGGGGEGGTTN